MASVPERLAAVRADPRRRRAALAAAVVVGLAVAAVHWVGFFLGGALVGLVSPDLKRALAGGLGFGLLAWAVFAAMLLLNGTFVRYLGMGQLLALSVAIPLVASVLGSLVRGVV